VTGANAVVTRRRLIAAGAVAVPAVAVAAAAAGTPSRRDQPRSPDAAPARSDRTTRLSFWGGWSGPDGLVMQRLVHAFNAASSDVQVTLTLYNWDIIFDRWRTEFDGGLPPDIIGFHAVEVAEYAARGMLYEVSRQAERHGLRADDYFPPTWRLCRGDGGLYAIPLDIHPLGLYINARAARRAGLDPRRPPRTGADLLSWAARLTDATRGTWGYAAPAGDVEAFRQWYSLLYQYGGRFLDDARAHCLANSPAGARAYRFLADAIERRHVAMPSEGSVDADFLAERVMMYAQGPWYIRGMQQAGIPFVTAPLPLVGARPAVWANSHALGVVNTQDAGRAEAAMRFIAWLDRHALAWAEAGQVPARNAARARLATTSIWPYLRPFAAQVLSIVYEPDVTMHTSIFAENRPTPVISATRAVLNGQETPAAAVRIMGEQVDQLIASPVSVTS